MHIICVGLLFNAIILVKNNLKWAWLNNIQTVLEKCNLSDAFNADPQLNSAWINIFKKAINDNDQAEWHDRAQHKSSLTNYLKFKGYPSLEPYLLDKMNFTGCNLKFKARSNTLNLEGRKASWSADNTGLCCLCNYDKETIDHFMFECSSLDPIRNDVYKTLQQTLYHNDLDIFWDIFINGSIDMKRHLMLDNIFQDNYDLGNVFDQCCKSYLISAWRTRSTYYNDK